ncbi:DUF7619 domain-containing protein [Polluticoccus soli]|uniref:DUF7619 domain-containing protein n=1 Tax=Polluticoccus soli TaxID=3034150 RepID=UPI0023E1035D|nr:T9SS type A sorting domain-containing protein [Flavipsychrobacter sp. JY13-12]
MTKTLLSVAIILSATLFTTVSSYAQTASIALTTPPCNNNGVLTATFTGMTPPITVNWWVGSASTPITQTVTSSTAVLTSYSGAGVWLVATSSTGTAQASYQGAPPFLVSTNNPTVICPALGTLTATVTGGLPPYTYQWYDKTNTLVGTSNPLTIAAGQYKLVVTDANSCSYSDDSVTIYETNNINFTVSSTTANCTNGTATATTPTGGVAPYSFLWSNTATSQSISGLVKGQYTVTATDAQGCKAMRYVNVAQSVNIGANITLTPATCVQNNGSATVFGSGGTPPYTYLWSNSGTTQTITGLTAGSYSVKVTDANGCFGTNSQYLSSSTPVNAQVTTTPSSCTSATGSATLSITGGLAPYNIQWFTVPAQTTTTATTLAAGTYSFKITDANNCVRTGSVNVPPINNVMVSVSAINATCTLSNGSLAATATGGATPYSYLWSNSATTPAISGLAAGGYSVKVTDNAGCSKTVSKSVAKSSPVNAALSSTPVSCIFNSDGSITANVWGGTAPYTYNWSNSQTTQTITGLKPGYYSVTVTDANGCTAFQSTILTYNASNNSCYCTITGTVYNDANSNCTQDAGELGIPNIQIHASGLGYAYTNSAGVYSFKAPTGSYTISETVKAAYPLASCQNNAVPVTVTAAANCSTAVNFANNTATLHDMHISTWNFTCPVPGFTYLQKCIITNMGTVAEPAVAGGYKTDGQIGAPTFVPGGFFTGTGNWRPLTGSLSLAPAASQAFTVNYSMPTSIPLNTSLVFTDTTAYAAPITNWLSDYSPWNNVNYYTPITVGSYDPNFKEVSPKGDGPAGNITYKDSVLEYMIHFQNLGTYKAQNIFILDQLDADLDWSTLTPIYKSHPCDITMSETGEVRFQFNNIDLPAKQDDEVGSNGMVSFSIKTKTGLALGTEFKNNAAIYFDFNDPVITNTTLNTLATVSVKEVENVKNSVLVYPNPTNSALTIKMNKDVYKTARLMNTMGQLVAEYKLDSKESQINVSNLPAGIYFMLLSGENGSTVERIEKQ